MISTAVFKLGGGNVQNALACPGWYLMHKPQQILIRISKTHTPPNSRFKVRSTARHVKGNHTLIRIPDINHAIEFFIATLDLELL